MIFSFYSYKGGVGRTLTLAHTAIRVAATRREKGYRVLLIDMDLEAPNLHLYLPPPEGSYPSGFAGLLKDYKESGRDAAWLSKNLERTDYILPVAGADNLFIMPAGLWGNEDDEQASVSYPEVIRNLREEFPRSRGPERPTEGFFFDFQKILAERFDYVFVDSRTGFADEAYASTILLADALVLCFKLNQANIEGIQAVFGNFLLREHKNVDDPDINVIPVAMPVPPRGGKDIEDWVALAEQSMGQIGSERILKSTAERGKGGGVHRIFHESTLEIGEHLVFAISGETETAYSDDTPIVHSFNALADRLTELNNDRDVLSAEALETYYYRRGDYSKALGYLFKEINLEPLEMRHWTDLKDGYLLKKPELRPEVRNMLESRILDWKRDTPIDELIEDRDRAHKISMALSYLGQYFGRTEEDGGLSILEEARMLCHDDQLLSRIEFLTGRAVDELVKGRKVADSFRLLHGREFSLEAACEHYSKAIELSKAESGKSDKALVFRARNLNELERHSDSISDYDTYILEQYRHPLDEKEKKYLAVVLREQSKVLKRIGYYGEAFQNLLRGSKLDPTSRNVMFSLVELASHLGISRIAENVLSKLEMHYTSDVQLYISKALYGLESKNYDDTLEACRLARVYSGKSKPQVLEAIAYVLQDKFELAREALKPVSEDYESDPLRAFYGYILLRVSDPDANRYIYIKPDETEFLSFLSVPFIAAGQSEELEEHLGQVTSSTVSLDEHSLLLIVRLMLTAMRGEDNRDIRDELSENFQKCKYLRQVLLHDATYDLISQAWNFLRDSDKIAERDYRRLGHFLSMINDAPEIKTEDLPPRNLDEPIW